jgi:hypothetical protein
MDSKTFGGWSNRVSNNDFPDINIKNIKEIFKEYFSRLEIMIDENVINLLHSFNFKNHLPEKIIIKDLIYDDPFEHNYNDEKVDDEDEYFYVVGVSKINKLLNVCYMLDNKFKEKCDIKNNLIETLKSGENEWKCEYITVSWKQRVGFF